jgi:hypothetical protein
MMCTTIITRIKPNEQPNCSGIVKIKVRPKHGAKEFQSALVNCQRHPPVWTLTTILSESSEIILNSLLCSRKAFGFLCHYRKSAHSLIPNCVWPLKHSTSMALESNLVILKIIYINKICV